MGYILTLRIFFAFVLVLALITFGKEVGQKAPRGKLGGSVIAITVHSIMLWITFQL